MSGPKKSSYDVTIEQKRRLEEERRIKRERAMYRSKLSEKVASVSMFSNINDSDVSVTNELVQRTNSDNGLSDTICKLKIVCEEIKKLSFEDEAPNTAKEEVLKKAETKIKEATMLSNKIKKISNENKLLLETLINKDILNSFQGTTRRSNATEEKKQQDEFKQKLFQLENAKKKSKARIEQYLDNDLISDQLNARIQNALEQIDASETEQHLKNYTAAVLDSLVRDCDIKIEKLSGIKDEFEREYLKHKILLEEVNLPVAEFKISEENFEFLKNDNARLEKMIQYDCEQKYISETIDTVMREMGYNVIGHNSVTKRSGMHYEQALYNYGNGTAVNVRYSDDGSIAMELGLIDDEDRLPDDAEKEVLVERMEEFCGSFNEFEKRLFDKGIVCGKRISKLPPSLAYAQIINKNDYIIENETETYEEQKNRNSVVSSTEMQISEGD